MTTSSRGTRPSKKYALITELMRDRQPGVEEPSATAEQLIDLYTQGAVMDAKTGKRLASPIYGGLSDMAKEGLLAEEDEFNPQTGHMNTRYRLLKVALPPKPATNAYKAKYLNALEVIEKLTAERDEAVKLAAGFSALLDQATSPAKVG